MATSTLRVLLAEQEFSETGLTLRSLCAEAGWGLEIVFVDDRSDLAQALGTHCPDVAFLQLALLQPDAPHALRVLRRFSPAIPFILFADPADTDSVVSCLSVGAQDFMLEGFMDERTMARALRSLVKQPIAAALDQFSTTPRPSDTCTSTRIPLSRPAPPTPDLSISICIEEPQHLLDEISAPCARGILLQFEERLRCAIRTSDVIAPLGPAKWSLRFPGVANASLASIAARLKASLRSFRPPSLSPARFVFSIAVGISTAPPNSTS